jgi:hypothetical protein
LKKEKPYGIRAGNERQELAALEASRQFNPLLRLLRAFPFGVELGQPLPGFREVPHTRVSIDCLKAERIVQSATDYVKNRFL